MKKYLICILLAIYALLLPTVIIFLFGDFVTNTLIEFLFLLLIILNTMIIIKIEIDYIKYGEKVNPFRKIKKHSNNELIIAQLMNLDTYQKYLIIDKNLVVINESGIFEFATFNKRGVLKGNIKDKEWIIDGRKISNPFIIKEDIFHYFIIQSPISFKVTGVWLTTKRLIYNTLEKRLNKKIYTKEKIDELYNNLKVKYGNNEN